MTATMYTLQLRARVIGCYRGIGERHLMLCKCHIHTQPSLEYELKIHSLKSLSLYLACSSLFLNFMYFVWVEKCKKKSSSYLVTWLGLFMKKKIIKKYSTYNGCERCVWRQRRGKIIELNCA